MKACLIGCRLGPLAREPWAWVAVDVPVQQHNMRVHSHLSAVVIMRPG